MGYEPELKLHSGTRCKKCQAKRREIHDVEHKIKRLTGGLSTTGRHVPMTSLKSRLAKLQNELQDHLDAEFDAMKIWDQNAAVKLNPSLATPAYKLREDGHGNWKI